MRTRRLWLIPVLWVVALTACVQEPAQHPVVPTAPSVQAAAEPDPVTAPTATTDVQSAHDGGTEGGQQYETVVPPLPPGVKNARDQLRGGGGLFPFTGLVSLEEAILKSDTIATVDYLSNRASVQRYTVGRGGWLALIEFRFEVHEYLKGSGPDEIGAFIGATFETEADAQLATTVLAEAHDSRWDDREAVVFLNYPVPGGVIPQLGAGQYRLASVGGSLRGYLDQYSVASILSKLWLPEATQTGASGSSTSDQSSRAMSTQLFLLDVPTEGSAPASGAGARPPCQTSCRPSALAT